MSVLYSCIVMEDGAAVKSYLTMSRDCARFQSSRIHPGSKRETAYLPGPVNNKASDTSI